MKATFTRMKEERRENESAHDLLYKMTRYHQLENPETSFERSFAVVCEAEPELHVEYLNSNGRYT